ncbi:hypothetical protein [Jeotgalibacillus proteolyticus]
MKKNFEKQLPGEQIGTIKILIKNKDEKRYVQLSLELDFNVEGISRN